MLELRQVEVLMNKGLKEESMSKTVLAKSHILEKSGLVQLHLLTFSTLTHLIIGNKC